MRWLNNVVGGGVCRTGHGKLASLLVATMLYMGPALAQESHSTWQQYEGGADSSHYSSLKQINRANVSKLKVAWTYPTGDNIYYSFNPIIVGNVMYVMAKNFSIVALNAATGTEIWAHPTRTPDEPIMSGRGSWPVRYRGINYWQSKDGSDRRLVISVHNQLEEIDAKTGKSITAFGHNGRVDLRAGLGRDPESIPQIQSGSPGRIFEDLIILGSVTGEEYMSPPGDIRAYNIRTGEMAWIFHTIPHPGEFGYDTWPKAAWKYIGGTNDWGGMTVDVKHGIVYVPTGSPTYDFYGVDRIGDDLFSDSVLALDARTGKRIWHYQMIHHDLWDYDVVPAPQLLTVQHDGKAVDIVAQADKNGFLFVLNRLTGKPLWPIEERPVPKSQMQGEVTSPTQPFPTHVLPFARQTFKVSDINPYLSEAEQAKWKETLLNARDEGLYTPPGTTDTVQMPGNHGGANWGSTAVDPTNGTFYVLSSDIPAILKLQTKLVGTKVQAGTAAEQGHAVYQQNCQLCHGPERAGNPPSIPSLVGVTSKIGDAGVRRMVMQGGGEMPAFTRLSDEAMTSLVAYLANQEGGSAKAAFNTDRTALADYPEDSDLPSTRYSTGYGLQATAVKPPWSTLTAYNLNTGEIKWQIPVGNAPEFTSEGAKDAGVMAIRDGVAVTAGGLIFLPTNEEGKLHAYDKDTGKELWSADLSASSEGIPSIYEVNGQEYLVVCATSPKGSTRRASSKGPRTPDKVVDASYVVYSLPKIVTAK